MLRTIKEAAELDLKRILAISDQLFREEEERRRTEKGDGNISGSRGHNKKRRKARKSLRDRVAYELHRRRMEHSKTGLAERRLRLEKRRRQWELQNQQQQQQQRAEEGEESGVKGRTRTGKARHNVEGLGLPPSSSSSFYASNIGHAVSAAGNRNGSDVDATKLVFNDSGLDARTGNLDPMEEPTESTSVIDDVSASAENIATIAAPAPTALSPSAFNGMPPMAGGGRNAPSLMDLLDDDDYDIDHAREQLNNSASPKSAFDTEDEITVARAGTTTTTPSLMELLENASAKHESYPSDRSMFATEDELAEPRGGSTAPTLMDLLDDPPVPNYEIEASTKEAAHVGVTNTKKEPTLLELLEDDSLFSNEKFTREYNNQSFSGSAEAVSGSAPCRLMDLLNENFDAPKKEESVSKRLEANDAQVQLQGSLIDLLNENFSTVETSYGKFGGDSNSGQPTFEAEDTGNNISDVLAQGGSLYTKQSSLTELLDESIAEDTASLDTSSSSSLLDLLDDDRGEVPSDTPSLLDLLDNEKRNSDIEHDADVHLDTDKEELDSGGSTGSLLDLLDDTPAPIEHSPSASSESVDLRSLLDADGDYGTDRFDTSSFDGRYGDLEASFVSSTRGVAAIVDELLALLISASRSEWNSINGEDGAKEFESQETEEALFSESDFVPHTDSEKQLINASLLTESLLSGAQRAQWLLSTDELNIMLLHLAMLETTHETMDLLVKIFKYMEDCRSRGHLNATPNAATYSILMTAFGK